MDDAVVRKFVEIFNRDSDWRTCHRQARRTGMMIFLHPRKYEDWVTGVKWDPKMFVLDREGPMAWRRDFVEKVTSLGYVPNLEDMPGVGEA